MKKIIFYRDEDSLIIKYNVKKVTYDEIFIFIFSVVMIFTLYRVAFTPAVPLKRDSYIFIALLSFFYLVSLVFRLYRFFKYKVTVIRKNGNGYSICTNGNILNGLITEIIKIHETGKYDQGFLIGVKDSKGESTTIIDHLPTDDATNLTLFLSTEIKVPIQVVDRDG